MHRALGYMEQGGEHFCKVELRIWRYYYAQMVIYNRSSGGLFVKIESRLSGETWGKLLSRTRGYYSRGRVRHTM